MLVDSLPELATRARYQSKEKEQRQCVTRMHLQGSSAGAGGLGARAAGWASRVTDGAGRDVAVAVSRRHLCLQLAAV